MPEEDKAKSHIVRERINPADDPGSDLASLWPPIWMTTYADMVTNLMTFFVLLFALTMINKPFDLVRFVKKGDVRQEITGQNDYLYSDPKEFVADVKILQQIQQMPAEESLALSEMKTLKEQAETLKETLEKGKLADGVKVKITAEDVVIIPSAPLVFAEGSDRIKASFFPILDRLAWLLKETNASIRIEGHTDDTPIDPLHQDRFSSNFELSAARAIAVGRYFIEKHAVLPERISVAGYGPLIPRYPLSDPEKKGWNRRVEFHIFISSETSSKEG